MRFRWFGIFFLMFSVFAVLELSLLVWIAKHTSVLFAVFLVFGTAAAGAALARTQGVLVLNQVIQQLSAGKLPTQPLMEGVLILIGGVLLITPGLITDCIGISVLIPVTRRFYVRKLKQLLGNRFRIVKPQPPRPPQPDIIDVDFREEE